MLDRDAGEAPRALCRGCGHEFRFSYAATKFVKAALLFGTVLEYEVPCPHCDYNLLGRRVGEVCSECGNRISRVIVMNNATTRCDKAVRSAGLVSFIIGLSIAAICYLSLGLDGVLVFWFAMSIAMVVVGYVCWRQLGTFGWDNHPGRNQLIAKAVLLVAVGIAYIAAGIVITLMGWY